MKFLALAAALLLCAAGAGAQSEPLIRIATGPDDPSTPLIYASRAGLFKKAGLNVDVQKLDGSAVIGAAMASGQLEIAKLSTLSAVTAIAKGLPFTIIGSIAAYNADNPSTALIVLANSPIKTAKDLVGQTLAGVSLKDQNVISTLAWLDQHGVDWKSVKYIEIPASASLAAMEAGRVAGVTVYEPIYTADMATGKVRVIGYPHDAVARHFPYGVLIASVAWANAHPEIVGRFLRVMQEAATYVAAHEAEVVPLLAQFTGVDPASLAKIHHPDRLIAIGPAELQPVIDTAVKYDVIAKPLLAKDLICSCALRR